MRVLNAASNTNVTAAASQGHEKYATSQTTAARVAAATVRQNLLRERELTSRPFTARL